MTPRNRSFVKKSIAIGVLGTALVAAAPGFDKDASVLSSVLQHMDASAHAARIDGMQLDKRAVQRLVVEEAISNRTVPPALALAVAQVESDFQPGVKSYAGARGVMQIMPATAWGEFQVEAEKLWEAETNIRLGVAFLEQLYHTYGERWDLALSHYNGGTLKKVGGRYVAHSYTSDYVKKVTKQWRRYQRENLVAELTLPKGPGRFTTGTRFHVRTVSAVGLDDAARTRDSWLLDDPKGGRSWRDYLKVADRWLKRSKGGVIAKSRDVSAAPDSEPATAQVASKEYRGNQYVIVDGRPVSRFRLSPSTPLSGNAWRFR